MTRLEGAALTSTALRHALAHFATGIAVVITHDEAGRPVGLTINSFTSVSLDPPIVAWSLISRSRYLPAFRNADCFSVSILGAHQQHLSERFARPIEDRFAGVDLRKASSGIPTIDGAIAAFDCRKRDIIEAGDHHMLLGEVMSVSHSDAPPLVYCKGQLQAWRSPEPSRIDATAG